GRVEGRVFSPPALPRIGSPRPVAAAEHAAAHDRRPDVCHEFGGDLIVGARVTAFHAVHLAEGPHRECPLVKLAAALAARILDALSGAGDIADGRPRAFDSVPRSP